MSWQQTGATSLSIDHSVGDVTGKSSVTTTVRNSTNFTLSASNDAGVSTTMAVVELATAMAPTITSFTATPSTLPIGGGLVHFAWVTSGATTLVIDQTVGEVSGVNSKDVWVSATSTFQLTATNSVGPATASTTVTVAAATEAPTIASFTATPNTVPLDGGIVHLAWVVTGASKVFIDDGVSQEVTGTNSKDVHVTANTIFHLTASNDLGSTGVSAMVMVELPAQLPVINSFFADPDNLPDGGGTSTLRWSVNGAQIVALTNGIGDVTGLTSKTVTVDRKTTYTLSATNARGSVLANVTIKVPPWPMPVITSYTATPATLTGPGVVKVSWSTLYAEIITIDQGVGEVTGTTSADIFVSHTTTYVLRAQNREGTTSSVITIFVK